MLITIFVVAEILVLLGSLIDFENVRLVAGRDFDTTRKLVAIQAAVALVLVIFLQIVGTATGEQHDSARKNIAGRLGSVIQSYTANGGVSNTGFTCTAKSYCGGLVDPDTFTQPVAGTVATASSGVVYTLGKNCAGSSSPTAYAIFYWQERAGRSVCLDSS